MKLLFSLNVFWLVCKEKGTWLCYCLDFRGRIGGWALHSAPMQYVAANTSIYIPYLLESTWGVRANETR